MATHQNVKVQGHTRYRLSAVNLDPSTSEYDVVIKLLVDGKTIHRLREIKKRQHLQWTNLRLPLDVGETSIIVVQVTEDRIIRNVVGKAAYQGIEFVGKDVLSAKCDSSSYAVELRILNKQMAEHAYSEAVAQVEQMTIQSGSIEKTGRVGEAFSKILKLGSMITEQDPTGGARAAFAACAKAWEYMEQQQEQEAILDELVKSLGGMVPAIDSIKGLANADLRQTSISMMELIEDVSIFIVAYKHDSVFKRAVRSMIDSRTQSKIDSFKATFDRLRKDFDTRLKVQLLHDSHIAKLEKTLESLKPINQASYKDTPECFPGTRADVIGQIVAWAQAKGTSSHLAWVQGRAGLGKSSVASSVCIALDEQGVLASTFFCKRDNAELRDPRNVLMTIARGLARRWEAYRDAVGAAIQKDPEIPAKRVQPLFDLLVTKPLEGLSSSARPSGTVVFVVDALDECGDEETRRLLLVCLRKVSQWIPETRILVTSRNNPDIRDFFESHGCSYDAFDLEEYDASVDIQAYVQDYLSQLQTSRGWPQDGAKQIWIRSAGLFICARTACTFIAGGLEPVKRLNLILAAQSWGDIDELYTTTLKAALQGVAKDDAEFMRLFIGAVVTTSSCALLSSAGLAALLGRNVSSQGLKHVLRSFSSVLYEDKRLDGAVRISHPSFVEYITSRDRSNDLCVDTQYYNGLIAQYCLEAMRDNLTFNVCGLETSGVFNCDVTDLKARVHTALASHVVYGCRYWASHLVKGGPDCVVAALEEFLSSPILLYWLEVLSLLGELQRAPASLTEILTCGDLMTNNRCRTMADDVYRFVVAFYEPISQSAPHLYVSALAFAPGDSGIAQRMRPLFPRLAIPVPVMEKEWSAGLRTMAVSSYVSCVAWSPDSRRIVAGCRDNTLRVWDAETGEPVFGPLRGHTGAVSSVAYSPDGRCIASGSSDCTVRIWDAQTGEIMLGPLQCGSDALLSVAYSPDSGRIASESSGNVMHIWNATTGELVLELVQDESYCVLSMVYSSDGCCVASGSSDHMVRVHDAETAELVLGPLQGHTNAVHSVTYSPGGDRIASGSADHTVRVWDAQTGEMILGPLHSHLDIVYSIAYSPGGRYFTSGSGDHTVRVWDVETNEVVVGLLHGHSGAVHSIAYSPDNRRIASGSWDQTVRIWDTSTVKFTNAVSPEHVLNHMNEVYTVAYSPDGRHIASGCLNHMIYIWDSETAKLALGPLKGHSARVRSLVYSPTGHRIASGSDDKMTCVRDVETGEAILKPWQGHFGSVNCVAYSPDGRYIVTGSADTTLFTWDAETGDMLLGPMTGHSRVVQSVAYSPDGCFIASGSWDKTIRIWNSETGQSVLQLSEGHLSKIYSVAYSPDGRSIACSSATSVYIWDVGSGVIKLGPLQGHSLTVTSAVYSPDGRYVASGSWDNTLCVWDVDTGESVLGPLQGHSGVVSSVMFSPDGHLIASGSWDKTVRVWDITARTTVFRSPGNPLRPTYSAVYSPGGCHFAVGSTRCSLHVPSSDDLTMPLNVCTPFVSSGAPILPHCFSGNRLLVGSNQLARHISAEHAGWVITPDHNLLLWLPVQLRTVDDSLFSIENFGVRRPTMIDVTDFVHGSDWSSIMKPV